MLELTRADRILPEALAVAYRDGGGSVRVDKPKRGAHVRLAAVVAVRAPSRDFATIGREPSPQLTRPSEPLGSPASGNANTGKPGGGAQLGTTTSPIVPAMFSQLEKPLSAGGAATRSGTYRSTGPASHADSSLPCAPEPRTTRSCSARSPRTPWHKRRYRVVVLQNASHAPAVSQSA
jgi:hypothetical protein